MTFCREK